MISVLFVAKNSVYKTLTDSSGQPLDCWDEDRDALKWPGGNSIVAHPPCRLWCALSHLSTAPESERKLAFFAIESVRKWGGILEHPAHSKFWTAANLPRPGHKDEYGYCIEIPQYWFGHPADKETWLYFSGVGWLGLPNIPIKLGEAPERFSHQPVRNPRPEIKRHFRSATPIAFARWLVETAERCSVMTK